MALEDERDDHKLKQLTDVTREAAERWKKRQPEIKRNREALRKGLSPDSPERLRKVAIHRIERATEAAIAVDPQAGLDLRRGLEEIGRERILNGINDLVSVDYFERGLEAARAVGRITVGAFSGTGFLVGPGILLTNHHVLEIEDDAVTAIFDLDVEESRFGAPKRLETFVLRPEDFWVTDKDLDFTFVAVDPISAGGAPLSRYGFHPLRRGEGKIEVGAGVSVIQHPRGQPKMVALHNAQLVQLSNEVAEDEFCSYSADTDRGSSGAPVFNTRWEVIALHHASVPDTDRNGRVLTKSETGKPLAVEEAVENPASVIWLANEGIRVSRLVAALEKAQFENEAQARRRNELLALWTLPDIMVRSRPPAGAVRSAAAVDAPRLESFSAGDAGGTTLEVPITLSLRLGSPRGDDGA